MDTQQQVSRGADEDVGASRRPALFHRDPKGGSPIPLDGAAVQAAVLDARERRRRLFVHQQPIRPELAEKYANRALLKEGVTG
ncbi:hypothetical protein ABR737_00955 [Streptomyces sp. Edi2]|uniref:hypothetical protein n=1 Tax=Streptomyces sp. Edi2 TaxID=3162528 RepID=UPI0033066711